MKMVLGIFTDKLDANEAISQLESHGYNPKDLSVVMKDSEEAREFAERSGADVGSNIAGGAVTGGMLGGLAGLLIGIGAIAIPGVGAFLVGGPLAAALGLTGAAATTATGAITGALAGGLIGALTGMGVSEDDAEAYEKSVEAGGILLIVPVSRGDDMEVSDIMRYCKADQIRTVTEPETTKTRKVEEAGTYSPVYYSEVSRDPEDMDDADMVQESDTRWFGEPRTEVHTPKRSKRK